MCLLSLLLCCSGSWCCCSWSRCCFVSGVVDVGVVGSVVVAVAIVWWCLRVVVVVASGVGAVCVSCDG